MGARFSAGLSGSGLSTCLRDARPCSYRRGRIKRQSGESLYTSICPQASSSPRAVCWSISVSDCTHPPLPIPPRWGESRGWLSPERGALLPLPLHRGVEGEADASHLPDVSRVVRAVAFPTGCTPPPCPHRGNSWDRRDMDNRSAAVPFLRSPRCPCESGRFPAPARMSLPRYSRVGDRPR